MNDYPYDIHSSLTGSVYITSAQHVGEDMELTTSTTSQPSTTSVSEETSGITNPSCTNQVQQEEGSMLLLVVLPAGIGVLVIVAVVVAVLVCICCMKSANHHKK